MEKIGLFYGTDTGNTEVISEKLKEIIDEKYGADTVEVIEIYKKKSEEFSEYKNIIIGMPTWYDGELQGDWETFIPEYEKIDFTGKKVAFFGLGDQYGYSFYFCDALGIFHDMALSQGGEVFGYTSVDGYEYDASKAERDGQLVGLCIDVDNEDDMTDERIESWLPSVLEEFEKT